tara:strand:- start:536 stop:730 length:195 start_codon:yes stop_codon:yes gene_type:complete
VVLQEVAEQIQFREVAEAEFLNRSGLGLPAERLQWEKRELVAERLQWEKRELVAVEAQFPFNSS